MNSDITNNNQNLVGYEERSDDRVIVGARFSYWNKPNTLEEAKRFVEEYPEDEEIGTVVHIVKVVNFTSKELYDQFTTSVRNRWKFLRNGEARIGGCGWHYVKANSDGALDLEYVGEETEREIYYDELTGKQHAMLGIFWCREGVLIQFQGADMFLVDPEGFSYCRYIGLMPKPGYQFVEPSDEPQLNRRETKILAKIKAGVKFFVVDCGAHDHYSNAFLAEVKKLGFKLVETSFTQELVRVEKEEETK